MSKKIKINNKKFIRNIIICIIAWIVVSLILNYAPGFKRDKYVGITNLIINDEDVTEKLKGSVYIGKDGGIYLSKDDIATIFDKNIYYDEESSTIVTTSNTKTASFCVAENQMIINGVKQKLNSKVIQIDEVIYIPISELELVYNISVDYINETDVVVIENLNQGLIKAQVEENSKIKYKPRLVSKKVGEAQVGETVSCYYTTSKGWRLVRKEDGTLGYVKANILANEYIVRQDFDDTIQTKEINLNLTDGTKFTLYNSNNESTEIKIRTLFNFGANGTIGINQQNFEAGNEQIWATISNKGLEKQTNEMIGNYKKRTDLIDTIVNFVSKYRIRGINIDFQKVIEQNNFDRFIIELTPRLRELGITTNVVLNSSFQETNQIGIVDYLINEKGV